MHIRHLAPPSLVAALLAGATGLGLVSPAVAAASTQPTASVLVVSNDWAGTASIVDPATFRVLTTVNVVPDLQQRLAEIDSDPVRLFWFTFIRQGVGGGHDQLADDAYTSHDGRYLYVSRPSLDDVVAIDLTTRQIAWRTRVDGYRADHMALSPDGTRLVVSASTANVVDVLDTATGRIVGSFLSGDSPHENQFSHDGNLIFHASIGRVFVPVPDPPFAAAKGQRIFEVVDAHTLKVLRQVDIGQLMAQDGHPGYSSAVRPMAQSPDDRHIYMQLSYFHGFVDYDLPANRIDRVVALPVSATGANTPTEQYPLNSAHHGIAINPAGTKLCIAGTVDDYDAIVSTRTFAHKIIDTGETPYWATTSSDGRYCFVSISGANRIDVIDYRSERRIAEIPVGDHPQRSRMGRVLSSILGTRRRHRSPVRRAR
jgi:DNA-binding beta-propeller fold protein YncE